MDFAFFEKATSSFRSPSRHTQFLSRTTNTIQKSKAKGESRETSKPKEESTRIETAMTNQLGQNLDLRERIKTGIKQRATTIKASNKL